MPSRPSRWIEGERGIGQLSNSRAPRRRTLASARGFTHVAGPSTKRLRARDTSKSREPTPLSLSTVANLPSLPLHPLPDGYLVPRASTGWSDQVQPSARGIMGLPAPLVVARRSSIQI